MEIVYVRRPRGIHSSFLVRLVPTSTKMSSFVATFCCLFAASAILYGEAETTQETTANASFVTTPALHHDHDVSLTTRAGEVDANATVSSLPSHTEAHTTTLFGDSMTTIVDSVTTGAEYHVRAVDNVTLSPSNTFTTPPSGNTTTHDNYTTLHAIDGTPSRSGSTNSGSTSFVSSMQTSDDINDSTISPTDAMTDAYNETLDGATVHTTPVTIVDEPLATKSVDVADSDKDGRLQKNLGGALMPVYRMTSFFLERIVQTNYVTQVDRLIRLSTFFTRLSTFFYYFYY